MVFAAASLREVFTSLGKAFERSHPGVKVIFNFAGTQQLRAQLEHGASVDVFASADTRHVDDLARDGLVAPPTVFTRNEPVIVVSPEGARLVRSLAELPRATRIVLGSPEVPIGQYANQVLERARESLGPDFRERVEAHVVSREPSVRQVLTKIVLGEAQAAIVYRTDALSARGQVTTVELPRNANVIANYSIAIGQRTRHPLLARAWVDLILSSAGQRALIDAGFLATSERTQ